MPRRYYFALLVAKRDLAEFNLSGFLAAVNIFTKPT